MHSEAFPPFSEYRDLVLASIREDLGERGDVTSDLVVPADLIGVGLLVQKSVGVACGLPMVEFVCRLFDERLRVEMIPGFHLELIEGKFSDARQTPLLRIRGPMRSLLKAERTVLNFLQHMGGVATLTNRYAKRVEGTRAKVYDTRKTLPGYRALDKYAVRVGGGHNHRVGLYDMVLVKDNHIALLPKRNWAEQLQALVRQHRKASPGVPVEIEVANAEMFDAVIAMDGVDMILLDNMDCPAMQRCVEKRDSLKRPILLEASGGVTLETIRNIALTGVDRISVGALTHSAPALDVSLEIEPA
jgi:nicotinate-nucleotide pyrophosphorylase (carboxylating)